MIVSPERLEVLIAAARAGVNPPPEHLIEPKPEWVKSEHPKRAHHNAVKTHCPKGHPYDEENTRYYRTTEGGIERACLTCQRTKEMARRRLKGTPSRSERAIRHRNLIEQQVTEMYLLYATGKFSYSELALKFGVCVSLARLRIKERGEQFIDGSGI